MVCGLRFPVRLRRLGTMEQPDTCCASRNHRQSEHSQGRWCVWHACGNVAIDAVHIHSAPSGSMHLRRHAHETAAKYTVFSQSEHMLCLCLHFKLSGCHKVHWKNQSAFLMGCHAAMMPSGAVHCAGMAAEDALTFGRSSWIAHPAGKLLAQPVAMHI